MFDKMNIRIKNFETDKWITDKEDIIKTMNKILKSEYSNNNYSINKNTIYITIDYIKKETIEAIRNSNWKVANEGTDILKQLNY